MEDTLSLEITRKESKTKVVSKSLDEVTACSYIDLRGLAFFRIALGTLIFYMLMVRLPELRTFYTDWGVMPRGVLLEKYTNPWSWSLYLASGNIVVVGIIYTIHLIINFLFTLGVRTRLMTVLNWIFLISLYDRNYLVLHGGDDLIRLLLFMAIFLPLGAKYSIDSFLLNKDEVPKNNVHSSLASFGFILQLLLMYFFTGLLKNSPTYTEDGTAIWYIFQLERFTTPIAALFKSLPASATVLFTKTVFYIELLLPFVFMIPWKNKYFRYLGIGVFVSFHLGLSLFMYLDYFPYACIIGWLTLLPSDFWNYWESKISDSIPKSLTIYFDNKCNFCRKISKIIQRALFLPEDSLKEIQSEEIPTNLMEENNSWVVKSNGKYFTKYEAFNEIVVNSWINKIYIPGLISKGILKSGLGNFIYKLVSNNRSQLSKLTTKINGERPSLLHSIPTKLFLITILSTIVYTNIIALPPKEKQKSMPASIWGFRNTLGLHQRWALFAPAPSRDDGWLTIEGSLFNGTKVDIWNNGAPISDEKPEDMYKNTKGALWNKFILNLWDAKNYEKRLYFGRYICRLWNDSHPNKDEQVSTFIIYYFLEKTPDAFSGEPELAQKVKFWAHDCWKKT